MSDSEDKSRRPGGIDQELFDVEAVPAEETNQYGDETDTPARPRKKAGARKGKGGNRDKAGKKKASGGKARQDASFSLKKFAQRITFFDWLGGTGRREHRGRTIRILGREITFWPLFITVFVLVIVAAIVVDGSSFSVDQRSVTVVGLPDDLENYKILVLSDLNGRRFGDGQASLLRQINSLSYNCVVLLGDMVGADGDPEPLYELLEGLGTKKKVYFVCGDADPGPYVSVARDITGTVEELIYADWILGAIERGAIYLDSAMGIPVGDATLWLSNANLLNVNAVENLQLFEDQEAQETEGVLAGLASDRIAIPFTSYRKQVAKELLAAVETMQATDIHISLAHQVPSDELISASCAHDVTTATYLTEADLILAGHYCGGVIRLPFLGAFYINAPAAKGYGWFPAQSDVSGLSVSSESQVYISTGLSINSRTPLMAFRLLNRPQISVIKLTATLPESMLE